MNYRVLALLIAVAATYLSPVLGKTIENQTQTVVTAVAIGTAGLVVIFALLGGMFVRFLPALRMAAGLDWRQYPKSRLAKALQL